MPTPARVLYATQNVAIWPHSGTTGTFYSLPVNSVGLDITNPIENVLVFGTLGAGARVQKEPSKVKIAIKSYLVAGTPTSSYGTSQAFNASAINSLTGLALAGTYAKIVVEPYGFTGYGIMTNLALDASTNNFVTLDLSFEGLGSPTTAGYPTGIGNSSYAGLYPLATGVTPVTSNLVGAGIISTDPLFTGAPGGGFAGTGLSSCVSSAKFSLDIPSDVITCLGAPITGTQVVVAAGNVMVAKPPFKTTLTIEGTAASECDAVDFGTIIVSLPNPRLMSTSINQAVGNVGQTYNYSIEDISCTFLDSILATGVQPALTY